MHDSNWKIVQRGTIVHKDTMDIYEYIQYQYSNFPPEPFICAIPFNQVVDENLKAKFSSPIDASVLDGDSNYKVYPNEKPEAIKILLESENIILKHLQ